MNVILQFFFRAETKNIWEQTYGLTLSEYLGAIYEHNFELIPAGFSSEAGPNRFQTAVKIKEYGLGILKENIAQKKKSVFYGGGAHVIQSLEHYSNGFSRSKLEKFWNKVSFGIPLYQNYGNQYTAVYILNPSLEVDLLRRGTTQSKSKKELSSYRATLRYYQKFIPPNGKVSILSFSESDHVMILPWAPIKLEGVSK